MTHETATTTAHVELLDDNRDVTATGMAVLWSRQRSWGGELFQLTGGEFGRVSSGPGWVRIARGPDFSVDFEEPVRRSSGAECELRVAFRGHEGGLPAPVERPTVPGSWPSEPGGKR
jgi:hypothetical protein